MRLTRVGLDAEVLSVQRDLDSFVSRAHYVGVNGLRFSRGWIRIVNFQWGEVHEKTQLLFKSYENVR